MNTSDAVHGSSIPASSHFYAPLCAASGTANLFPIVTVLPLKFDTEFSSQIEVTGAKATQCQLEGTIIPETEYREVGNTGNRMIDVIYYRKNLN